MIKAQHLIQDGFGTIPDVIKAWQADSPRMGVWVLLPEAEKSRIAELQAVFRDLGVPMVGAVFPSLVTDQGFLEHGAWLLCFDVMPPWFLLGGLDADEPPAGQLIAASAGARLDEAAAAGEQPTLFMMFDAMLPNIADHLTGVHEALGNRVKYSGVNAGSETFQPMPCLFDSDRHIGNGVLGLLVPASAHVVAKHGYPVSKRLMVATSSTGNRIDRIDNRPAFDVYREVIKSEYNVDLTHENFYDYAVHYPLGLVMTIDVLVRIPVAFNEDGSVYCVGEVPPNTRLWVLRAPTLDESDCVDAIAEGLGIVSGEALSAPLLTFYCAGRRMHFGKVVAAEELAELKERTGASVISGALSLGEIDSIEELGFPRFHNACVVSLA